MRIEAPLTAKQLKEGDLIPRGTYQFQVLEAIDKVSKKGNDMIELKLKIWLDDRRERIIFDYLMEAMQWKLGHFAEVCGLIDQYNSNTLRPEDCLNKCGSLKLTIQSDKDGVYPDKNSVADYMPELAPSVTQPIKPVKQSGVEDGFDDDIPF